jgi:ribosomal protein S2
MYPQICLEERQSLQAMEQAETKERIEQERRRAKLRDLIEGIKRDG